MYKGQGWETPAKCSLDVGFLCSFPAQVFYVTLRPSISPQLLVTSHCLIKDDNNANSVTKKTEIAYLCIHRTRIRSDAW